MKPGVLLAGGGLDSTALLIWLAKQNVKIEAMHVDYGQKAWYSEHLAVEYFAEKYKLGRVKYVKCDLSQIGMASILRGSEMGAKATDNRLEGRNIVLMAMAATYAMTRGVDRVYVGFHKEPNEQPFPDATVSALEAMNVVGGYGYSTPIYFEAPFYQKTRLEIFQSGKYLDEDFVARSYTCYEGRINECGKCVHCLQKQEMMRLCAA